MASYRRFKHVGLWLKSVKEQNKAYKVVQKYGTIHETRISTLKF